MSLGPVQSLTLDIHLEHEDLDRVRWYLEPGFEPPKERVFIIYLPGGRQRKIIGLSIQHALFEYGYGKQTKWFLDHYEEIS